MDVCVENVFITPAIEAINVIQATAEEENHGASCNAQDGSQDKEAPRYKGAGQETATQSPSDDPSAGPASPSETPKPEAAAEKNPWSAWAWLGICKNPSHKISNTIPNIVHVDVDAYWKFCGWDFCIFPARPR